MKPLLTNALLSLEIAVLACIISLFAYAWGHTQNSPKFFPTELKQVRSDFGLELVEPVGAPNPNYHPTYANQQNNPNSTN